MPIEPPSNGYPTMLRYLETVGGIDAHDHVMIKASVLADSLRSRPLSPLPNTLAPALERLISTPPPMSSWIPEVHFNAIMLATYDEYFSVRGMTAYLDWVYNRNRALLSRPTYRILFVVMTPSRLISGIDRRWSAFRKGSTLSVVRVGDGAAELTLEFPRHLHTELTVNALSAAWRAALECAGGKHVESTVVDHSATRARYAMKWRSK